MNNAIEQLDEAIDAMLAGSDCAVVDDTDELSELIEVARELHCLPRAEFKERLRADLQRKSAPAEVPALAEREGVLRPAAQGDEEECVVLPTLFGKGYGSFPIHRVNFATSFVLHAAAAALVVSSGLWVAAHREQVRTRTVAELIDPGQYVLPAAPDKAGGGGGGGDADKLPASKGTPPRFSRTQLAPPTVVVRNPAPRLPVEATVIGPPQISFASGNTGDPLSSFLTASNGTGSGGGIGSGSGGGVGSGRGAGVGPGWGGGIGGGAYRVGGGVSAPRAIYDPEPEYSEEARKAKYQGIVILWAVIGPDGHPRELRVQRSLGMGLDEKAIEAVRNWRFTPAMKDGQPVPVHINIEVSFRLY